MQGDGTKRIRTELATIEDPKEREQHIGRAHSATMYGEGGFNRWHVRPTGEVVLSNADRATAERARAKGFTVIEQILDEILFFIYSAGTCNVSNLW
ncbi:hypothetical protein COV04_00315 [Candidatus Uhrbacteria bacterium CG10_big_fil_rev_8_21_14_0_10_48_11]|uniref:Uncharacterized protein n=1 Tax=Candidatus Uhrbacteria bacterium CG10_big_fil_rev_8_21_14_0_10_48_11 TaxID=1975037 RepID=A0A2M8LFU5_9BACT|nr:MAG: hypothetical protein COV04_00315 [Candidatus Uhrbacteria bacterium CG10_big_fil_rev_8_21_14_0_10_48_11]